jgi:hypothetical protein
MKLAAEIRKFKDKKLETVEKVRAALIAILEDIESGAATVSEATPFRDEIKKMMRKPRAQMKSAKPKDKAALKSFFGK